MASLTNLDRTSKKNIIPGVRKASSSSTSRTSFGNEEGDASILNVPDRLKFLVGEQLEDEVEKKDDQSDKFEEFEQWLVENGAEFPDLYLKKYGKAMRGVHCKDRVPPYTTIVKIPRKLLITDKMGRETELGKKLFSSNYSLSTPNLVAVILYVLSARDDPNHFFQPYFKILPSDYSSFPIFYNDEQLSWLEGSPLIDDIIERKRNMRADYDEICRVLPEFEKYSYEEFLDVRTAVGSRNFGIVIGSKATALVPMADMLNHYRPRETSWTFNASLDAFTITSLSPLLPGQQVMDSYGKKCNGKFLLHYGFAVENNREADGHCQNEILLRLSLEPNDPLHGEKLALLGGRSSRGFRLSMNIEDRATSEALSFCRIACATEEEVSQVLGSHGDNQEFTSSRRSFRDAVSFISVRNEVAALEFLAATCENQLRKYPKSMVSNMELLETTKPFSIRRTTLIVIIGEQEICHFWVNTYNRIAKILRGTENGDSPIHMTLRSLPRSTFEEADMARYASRLAYEIRMCSNKKD